MPDEVLWFVMAGQLEHLSNKLLWQLSIIDFSGLRIKLIQAARGEYIYVQVISVNKSSIIDWYKYWGKIYHNGIFHCEKEKICQSDCN